MTDTAIDAATENAIETPVKTLPETPAEIPARSVEIGVKETPAPAQKALDAKVPQGPIAEKWDTARFNMKLMAPANRRKFRVIMVGSGLAGGSAAASLAELGFEVDCFAYQDSPRRVPTASPHRAASTRPRTIATTATAFFASSMTRLRAATIARARPTSIAWRK